VQLILKEVTMCRPCVCRAVLALLIIILAWWQIGYNQILITIFAVILLIMALAGNVCCCRGYKCEKKGEGKKLEMSIQATTMEPEKPAVAKKKARKKKR
jgi:hypothetical protein